MNEKGCFLKKISKELLSWKVNNTTKKKFYETKKIPINILSLEKYQKKIESLFLEESKTQFNQIFRFFPPLIEMFSCNFVSKAIKENKFIAEIEIFSNKFQNFREGDYIIFFEKSGKKEKTYDFRIGLILEKNFFIKKKFLIEVDHETWKNIDKKKCKTNLINLRTLFSLKSIFKEYQVLNNVKKIPLGIKQFLFSETIPPNKNLFFKEKIFSNSHFNKHFNASQINGIFATLNNSVSLIQGPPGTGKTRTILGIVFLNLSNFLIQTKNFQSIKKKKGLKKNFFKKFELSKPKISFFLKRKKFSISTQYNERKWKILKKCFYDEKQSERIIVCAFSNTAIDENTIRITYGLPMQKINCKFEIFEILRLGPNYKFFLDHITLDSYALIWASENDHRLTIWEASEVLKNSRAQVIKKSKLIYTTLACAAYSYLDKIKKKETLIIDEAAQAIELSTLVPIRKTCEKLILVGDIQQLPATIFSQSSLDLNYERSLFKRLQLKKYPIYFLETQFRMHPQISTFVSRKFYKNGLKDSQIVKRVQKFHFLRCFGPILFLDASEGLDKFHRKQKNSWCNLEEIRIISFIFRTLICLFSDLSLRTIGIIASYQGQISEIQENGILKRKELKGQVNTVDGFQGREKNIILFSSVRAKNERGIGFLSDCRRMNVAFTRAKFSFWGIGNAWTLKKDLNWFEGLFDFQKRGRFFGIRKPLERSNRRLIYWNLKDEKNYSEDGDNFSSLNFFLIYYIGSIFC